MRRQLKQDIGTLDLGDAYVPTSAQLVEQFRQDVGTKRTDRTADLGEAVFSPMRVYVEPEEVRNDDDLKRPYRI